MTKGAFARASSFVNVISNTLDAEARCFFNESAGVITKNWIQKLLQVSESKMAHEWRGGAVNQIKFSPVLKKAERGKIIISFEEQRKRISNI